MFANWDWWSFFIGFAVGVGFLVVGVVISDH